MSGGQDEAASQIGSSGDLPSFAELLEMPSEPCPWFQEDEDAEDARDAKAAIDEGGYVPYDEFREHLKKENDMDELDLNDVDITNTRRTLTMPVGSRKMLAMESDMDDELDLSKPCEATFNGVKWFPTVGPPVWDRSEHYGCFREDIGGVLSFCWYPRARIRNIHPPQYEPHTRESLLPFAGEWVHHIDDSNNCFPFNRIANDEVEVDRMVLPYKRLADKYVWATGPDKGKPVAKLLPPNEA